VTLYASRHLPSPDLRAAADRIAVFLAEDDVAGRPPAADLVILAGSAVLAGVGHAVRLAHEAASPLLIAGGIGHSTADLDAAVAADPELGHLAPPGRPEAETLGALAVRRYGFPADRLLIEAASTNTGENAAFGLDLLRRVGLAPRRVALVQDPLMQRRAGATFRHVFGDEAATILSAPPFVPRLDAPETAAAWTAERYVSLLLGEIPRLRDEPGGYGPRGRGFIAHVDVPGDVEAAYALVRGRLADLPAR
jgi:uncharacterized SAM-binding protein YcdF (DUF218 family)